MTCPECGSDKVIPNTYLRDQGESSDGELGAAIQTRPEAWIFKGIVDVKIRASICCSCGWLKLRCHGDLDKMWETHLRTGAGN